jgi:hypothetical protein
VSRYATLPSCNARHDKIKRTGTALEAEKHGQCLGWFYAEGACDMISRMISSVVAGAVAIGFFVYGIGFLGAQLGLQDAVGPHSDWLVWAIRLLAIVAGALVVWAILRLTASWSERSCRRAAIVFAIALVPAVPAGILAYYLHTVDSDYEMISSAYVNDHLGKGCDLPASASGIRLQIRPGLAYSMLLSFKAAPQDARDFVERVRKSLDMKEGVWFKHNPELKPSRFSDKIWWKVKDDKPWYGMDDGYLAAMVQLDNDRSVVFLMLYARG